MRKLLLTAIVFMLAIAVTQAQQAVKGKITDEKRLEEIDKQVKEEVEDAVRFADESPLPDPEELYTDVYATPIK